MERKFTFEFTERELNAVYSGLLELPAKVSMPVIESIKEQLKKVENEKGKNENEKEG